MKKNILSTNPAAYADAPFVSRSDPTGSVWTTDQTAQFLAQVSGDRLRALWWLAASTGARRSELLGLKWHDIDLDSGTLSIRRTLILVDGRMQVGKPKTDKSRRTIDIDAHTSQMIRKHRATQLKERMRASDVWGPGEWVFTNEIGQPIRPDWVTRRFSRLVAATALPRITFHQLRHGHATALLAAGINPRIAQERLGHYHPSFTMAVYQSVLPNMQREAAERISVALRAETAGIGDG